MRVASSFLAAGLAASAYAAPGARRACQDSNSADTSKASGAAAHPATGAAGNRSTAGSGLAYFGASVSGAEFGQNTLPGHYGKEYIFPDTKAIQGLIDMGMNMFRIPFLMERLTKTSMAGELDADYLKNLTTVVNFITGAGKLAVLDPHNYARYNGQIITSTADFKTFWTNVATEFKDNDKVVFDCNNEPHELPTETLAAELNQACVDGVRGAGATTQYIFLEGTAWTGAWSWMTSGNSKNMGAITDTVQGKLVYEMHQYLDQDASGTSPQCVSATIGEERLKDATNWLRENKKIGILGEFAGGNNDQCKAAIKGMLDFMTKNSDVWMGALWWGAGPWWADYMYSMEPPSGTAYLAYKDILSKYMPAKK